MRALELLALTNLGRLLVILVVSSKTTLIILSQLTLERFYDGRFSHPMMSHLLLVVVLLILQTRTRFDHDWHLVVISRLIPLSLSKRRIRYVYHSVDGDAGLVLTI